MRLMREAGRTEPALAAAYQTGRARGESLRRKVFGTWPDTDPEDRRWSDPDGTRTRDLRRDRATR